MSKQYNALTIDTCTIEGCKFNFNGNLLKSLNQFKNSPINIVISEVVDQEIRKHLAHKFQIARDNTRKLKVYFQDIGWNNEKINALLSNLEQTPVDFADTVIEEFYDENDIVIIPSIYADISKIVRMYFNQEAPFETSKKHEFPDAIALKSIEKWAHDKNKKVLVVSSDNGWIKYTDSSENLTGTKSLSEAIELLRNTLEHSNFTHTYIREWFLYQEGKNQIESHIKSFYNELDPVFHADTFTDYIDTTLNEISINNIQWDQDSDDEINIKIINSNNSLITFELEADIDYSMLIQCEHYKFDEGSNYLISSHEIEQSKTDSIRLIISLDIGIENGKYHIDNLSNIELYSYSDSINLTDFDLGLIHFPSSFYD